MPKTSTKPETLKSAQPSASSQTRQRKTSVKPSTPLEPAVAPSLPSAAATPPPFKQAALVALLERGEGATIDQLMAATGWQKHSVRGFISGTVKKKMGLEVVSESADAGRVYRIVKPAEAGHVE